MIQRFFKKTARKQAVAPSIAAGLMPGTVVWAVGDIHGCRDLLDSLIVAIVDDAKGLDRPPCVVFLGDYIDRGPDSRGVIDRLVALKAEPSIETRFLKGNHEAKMLEFIQDPTVGAAWCEYGGVEALASFGLKPPGIRHRKEGWVHLAADLDHQLTPAQRGFLENLELGVTIEGYFFAHAGARPGIALDAQDDEDLMWIRSTFLHHEDRFSHTVVHGHTPARNPYTDHRRINVDTKAYESGVLTAVRLEGVEQRFVQAVHDETGVIAVRDYVPTDVTLPMAAVE